MMHKFRKYLSDNLLFVRISGGQGNTLIMNTLMLAGFENLDWVALFIQQLPVHPVRR